MRLFTIARKLLLGSFSCCLFMALNSQAQERAGSKKITGKILSSTDNKPLADASISVPGTSAITVSDNNGQFTIEASPGDRLLISMIGYQQKEVKVGKSNTLEIKLEQTAIKLDD